MANKKSIAPFHMEELLEAGMMEEFFDEHGIDAISSMARLLKTQHETALGLTKLVLEYGKEDKITKDLVFTLFKEANELLSKQIK